MADEEGRVFLRGISSETYGLSEFRRRQRAAPRVRRAGTVTDDATVGHSGDSDEGLSRTWWMLGPGDEPFLTQTLQVHFVELKPAGSNHGHGHQNEAQFYILEGKGYEIHDGKRYDWEKDDFVIVHTDSVHRHFNASQTERALALVIKAKATWMTLGMIQQGRSKPFEDGASYEPPRDWTQLWTPGATDKKKVVKKADTKWETTRDGRVRVISSPQRTDVRTSSVDVYEQEIARGSRSAKHWHMADEVAFVLSGRGECLQWDVEAEIGERYQARIAKEPTRWKFSAGDLVYVPQNTVHEYAATGDEALRLLVAQNRLFKLLGYDSVVYLDDAREPDRDVMARSSAPSR
ncbi:MAG TPA: cupin domain-containing protein [Candidatus Limnocylindria bacterium]|nr:cupin domain-containing protein [Candidatus Limnocylindria bacterium]